MNQPQEVWSGLASQWHAVGTPQRPSKEDVDLLFEQILSTYKQQKTLTSSYSACVLGVTPELIQGPWPYLTTINAVERSADVISRLWKPHPELSSTVHQAEWHHMPVEAGYFDVVAGDGCVTQFPDRAYYKKFFEEMYRVINATGFIAMRCFLRPTAPHPLETIAELIHSGEIENFGSLKWLIAMSIVNRETLEVKVADIAATFDRHFQNRDALVSSSGWSLETINSINAYYGSTATYTFPTHQELEKLCQPYFKITSAIHGTYELSPHCPVLKFERSSAIRQE